MTSPRNDMESEIQSQLDQVSLREMLEADSRPTFVIDLDRNPKSPQGNDRIVPVFCNAALRLHERLLHNLVGPDAQGLGSSHLEHTLRSLPASSIYQDFVRWVTRVTTPNDLNDVYPPSFLHGEFIWSGSTVRQRWRLISGNRLWGEEETHPRNFSSVIQAERHPEVKAVPASREASESTNTSASDLTSQSVLEAPASKPLSSDRAQSPSRTPAAPLDPARRTHPPKEDLKQTTHSKNSNGTKSSSKKDKSFAFYAPERAVADWTAEAPRGQLSPHLQFARSIDWSATNLGPMNKWTPELRQLANLTMANPHPAALFWGTELTILYNKAYAAEVAGNKHPGLMGTGYSGPFSELWDYIGPVFKECAKSGISVRKENELFSFKRHQLLDESFYSWSFIPLFGGATQILGFYNASFETTNQVLARREMESIRCLGELASDTKTVKSFWKSALEALGKNSFDFPLIAVYTVGESDKADQVDQSCHLEGVIGVPEGHPAARLRLNLKYSREGFVPSFREARRTREPTLLRTRDGTLPETVLKGIRWRGYAEPCREAIVLPVQTVDRDAVVAFLLIGLNPRRPYDDKYKSFISILHRQLVNSLTSVNLLEKEAHRSRYSAQTTPVEKEQPLALKARRLGHITEFSPLGMFLVNSNGVLTEANDRFYEMSGQRRENQSEFSWMEFILDTSKSTMEKGWKTLIGGAKVWSGELQLRKSFGSQPVKFDGTPIDYWAMFYAHAEFAPDGSLASLVGSIVDISHFKWAQGLQNRRLEEAEETRRQQNQFIDTTSHEMRNPLSAVLQCADDICTALDKYRANSPPPPAHVVESCADAARTIVMCVQHQKSIVDDILTLSKLDSNLLVITPSAAQPADVLRRALKMFELELQMKDIHVVQQENSSYQALGVDWVTIDSNRILQILINLMTNAIKFTSRARRRVITVGVGASVIPPMGEHVVPGFRYVPSKSSANQVSSSGDWGNGDLVYIHFYVEDTGCGLTPDEKDILFQRFRQASPRTHAQYGGSGLGLFICRNLTELHGGQIGVASTPEVGSIFSLYVQARRTNPPPDVPAIAGAASNAASLSSTGQQTNSSVATSSQSNPQQQASTSAQGVSRSAIEPNPSLDPEELHILVVEDNLINQQVLVGQLRKAGCTVTAANDGSEALEFLDTTRFRRPQHGRELSIILMDLEMPIMDGLTCVRRIRQMEQEGNIRGHVPVIAVTANVRDEQVASARTSGMDEVISKPFRVPELMRKIEALLVKD